MGAHVQTETLVLSTKECLCQVLCALFPPRASQTVTNMHTGLYVMLTLTADIGTV